MLTLHQDYHIGWRIIGKLLNRPFTTCYSRYLNTIRPALDRGWTPPIIQDQPRLKEMIEQAKTIAEKAKLEAASKVTKKVKNEATTLVATRASGKRAVWDPATDQAIIDMVKDGKSWPHIGKTLNRPYASCYTRYYATLDPTLEEIWTPDLIERLSELASQGLSWKRVGQRLRLRALACRTKWAELGRVAIPPIPSTSHSTLALSPGFTADMAGTSSTTTETADIDTEKNTKGTQKVIAFSQEESRALIDLVEEHGDDNWDLILHSFRARFLRETEPSEVATLAGATVTPASTTSRSQKTANKRLFSINAANLRHQFMRLSRDKVLWTLDQETLLIQQVLRLGTEGHWDEIARTTGLHSPQDCRTHWKNLDMPVNLNPAGWTKVEQGIFWSLWREFGSDFERLSKFSKFRSPADCQQYFENTTKNFPDRQTDPEGFNKKVRELYENLPNARQKYLFTKERSLRLQKVMRYYLEKSGMKMIAPNTWNWIANKVQRGMSPTSCIEHWMYLRRNMDVIHGPLEEHEIAVKPLNSSSWSHEELKLLDQGVRELGSSWSEIQLRYLPWRTTRSIRQRWMTMSDRSSRITEDEYYTIVGAGNKSSEINYDALAKKMPGWNRSPCRRIFETSYKHLVASTVWLPEEDRLLLEKTLKERGRDWNAIAMHFHGAQTARAPLYAEAMARIPATTTTEPPMRTHKTAWQCRLRWCQLLMPVMPKEAGLFITGSGRNVALELSRQLLDQYNNSNSKSNNGSDSTTTEALVP
ncbi:hypothetical protein BGZ50_005239 [Haplosporangium sp. Z 11]|nr:hypothetical protein BGZ50_005239 [Haplosporangium sp. Z 11]